MPARSPHFGVVPVRHYLAEPGDFIIMPNRRENNRTQAVFPAATTLRERPGKTEAPYRASEDGTEQAPDFRSPHVRTTCCRLTAGIINLMTLQRQIPELVIDARYRPFVDEFVNRAHERLNENLDSLYICGSIARGRAVPNRSDADFTVVTKKELRQAELEALSTLKDELIDRYPFVTKIDTPACTVKQVLDMPYEWGFWIAIVSRCIYGRDLVDRLQPLNSAAELLVGLSRETETAIEKRLQEIRATKDIAMIQMTCRKLMRRVIRGFIALTVVAEDVWTDDLEQSRVVLHKHFAGRDSLIDTLFDYHDNPTGDKSEIQRLTAEAMEAYREERRRAHVPDDTPGRA